MKADIITMHMINNYGSVLQTYATCEMFRMAQIEAEIVDYYPERLVGYGSLKQLYIDAKPFHKNTIKCIIVALINCKIVFLGHLQRSIYRSQSGMNLLANCKRILPKQIFIVQEVIKCGIII